MYSNALVVCSFKAMIKLFYATSLALQDNQYKLYITRFTHQCSISTSYSIFFTTHVNAFTNAAIVIFHKHVPNERFKLKKDQDKQQTISDYKTWVNVTAKS